MADGRVVLSGGVRMDGNEVNAAMANPFRQLSPRMALALECSTWLELQCQCGQVLSASFHVDSGIRESGVRVNAREPTTSCVISWSRVAL